MDHRFLDRFSGPVQVRVYDVICVGDFGARADASPGSPLTANIYFPAIPALSRDFHKSVELINLTVWHQIALDSGRCGLLTTPQLIGYRVCGHAGCCTNVLGPAGRQIRSKAMLSWMPDHSYPF